MRAHDNLIDRRKSIRFLWGPLIRSLVSFLSSFHPEVIIDIQPIHRCAVGIDVHLNLLVVCVIIASQNGEEPIVHQREFGGFKRDRRAMAQWIAAFSPDIVVMESTGIYWKSPYAALEQVGIRAYVVNAFHVSKVPGRKTDVSDAQWLAMLGRAGLLNNSFIPPAELRHLRLVARYHERLQSMLAAEKNRSLRVLADAGVRLSVVASDPHGSAARQMVDVLIAGGTPEQAVRFAGRLKADRDDILAALDGELSPIHIAVIQQMRAHIEWIENALNDLEAQLLRALANQAPCIDLLTTIPGIDRLAAAKLLVEIGTDMTAFASPQRLARWVGVSPGNNESAKKHKPCNTPKGNPYARALLSQVANAAVKTRCYFREKFASLQPRRGFKKAIIAIAHKIIKVVYILLSRNLPYKDNSADFEALYVKRNAPRWIKQIKKYSQLPLAT